MTPRDSRIPTATLVLTSRQWVELRDAVEEGIRSAEADGNDARRVKRWASLLREIEKVRLDL